MRLSFLLAFCILSNIGFSQSKITLEDIFQKGTFRTQGISGFNFMKDGRHYTLVKNGNIQQFDITNGSLVKTLFDSKLMKGKSGFNGDIDNYSLSEDESKILIETESSPIYRHSSNVKAYIYTIGKESLDEIYSFGKVANPQLSPDGNKVAFTHNNNLYYKDLGNQSITQITIDGVKNKIINGLSDWVYEEEFGFTRAFYWSPDSKKIAFLKFDESLVPEFTMQIYKDDMYPQAETFKYPKVGENNSIISSHVFSLQNGKSILLNVGDLNDKYIPRIKWSADPNSVCVFVMNRHQNELSLYLVNSESNQAKILLRETNKYYIDITDDLTFLKDNKQFIWTSEKDGYNQIYLYKMDGTLQNKITNDAVDVTSFYGVDEKNKKVYFQSFESTPIQRFIYTIDLNGKNKKNITPSSSGTNNAQFSSTFDYFVHTISDINTAPKYTIKNKDNKLIRTVEDNLAYKETLNKYNVSNIEFFTFTTTQKVNLNGWMLKPKDFNPTRKYPVFMTQYSGPGSQSVTDSWKGTSYWWYQMLAQNGYIVVCVDGRGTGARGEEFKKMTYLNLGDLETIDQIETAKYLGSLAFVDKARIGIFGWSYGGFISALSIFKGNDVFKAAIAIAPVTSWKWYDSIYTERYMRTLAENEKGYRDNSPVYFADRLKGNFLLAHGMADDNVHFQHSVELVNALIRHNKQFDTYYYPNRNHGIYGDNATMHLYSKMTNFIYEKI